MITGGTKTNYFPDVDFSEIDYCVREGDIQNLPESTLTTSSTDDYTSNLDEFHYHEMLDRLHLMVCNIQDFLADHPVAIKHKRLGKKIDKAGMLLAEAYQMVGSMEYRKFDDKIYSQKDLDNILNKAGILTGKDAEIFLNNIENPIPLSEEIKKIMRDNYEKIKGISETK